MAKKKEAPKPEKKLTIAEKMKRFDDTDKLLGGKYDIAHLKKYNLYDMTVARRLRYWCYKIHFSVTHNRPIVAEPPKGVKEFVESLPGFAGWKYFAHTWDVAGENPFMIVLRLQSVWQEWDAVMDRVAIPIDAPPEQISARIQALTDDYSRRHGKKF